MSSTFVLAEPLDMPQEHYQADLSLWHQYQGDGTNDCAAFSIAIAANAFLNRAQFDGFEVAREMERLTLVRSPVPHWTLRKIPQWIALPWGVSGYLQSKHIPARLSWFASVDRLRNNIRNNRLSIVFLGDLLKMFGHAKVLYGYERSGPQPQQGFYFVDPGYRKEYSRPNLPLGVFWQDEKEFKQQWNNLFGILIEITARAAGDGEPTT